jgi:hypothetical protein
MGWDKKGSIRRGPIQKLNGTIVSQCLLFNDEGSAELLPPLPPLNASGRRGFTSEPSASTKVGTQPLPVHRLPTRPLYLTPSLWPWNQISSSHRYAYCRSHVQTCPAD